MLASVLSIAWLDLRCVFSFFFLLFPYPSGAGNLFEVKVLTSSYRAEPSQLLILGLGLVPGLCCSLSCLHRLLHVPVYFFPIFIMLWQLFLFFPCSLCTAAPMALSSDQEVVKRCGGGCM